MFCRWPYIESSASGVFGDLAAEGLLAGLPRGAFVARLAHYYGEINAIHPFREGNGQLARDGGWRIAWSELDGAENDIASAASLRGDLKPLVAMLECLVRPL